MARVTVEMKIEIPSNTEDFIPNGKEEFFDTVEAALQSRFSDYFLKTENGGLTVRCVVFLNTHSGTEDEAAQLLQQMAEAVVEEVQTVMSSKMR